MEEKKLTDEEIDVGMIEKSVEREKYLTVWLLKESEWKSYSLSKILDLIHRLQADNIQLKAIVSGLEDEKKVESIIFGLKETISEQKAEIERLAKVEIDLIGKIADKSAEIERLTDTLNQYINGELINADTMGKIIYLEKQVDDLTAKNEHLDSENTRLICEMDKMLDEGWDIMDEEADGWYKKGCKDTAKEIYRKAEKKAYFKDGGHYDKDRYLLDMADLKGIVNGYGVEVE